MAVVGRPVCRQNPAGGGGVGGPEPPAGSLASPPPPSHLFSAPPLILSPLSFSLLFLVVFLLPALARMGRCSLMDPGSGS